MYSQNNEEQIITDYFGETPGRFLDVGAYDGKTFSNTLRLVELGWEGYCLEASPFNLVPLINLHKEHPKVTVINTTLAPESGWAEFYDCGGDAVSSIDPAHVERGKTTVSFRKPFLVRTSTMGELFGRIGHDFEFVNLDVEGISADLFQFLPLEKMPKLRMLCVEHDGYYEQIEQSMLPHGFTRRLFNGENLIMAR